MHFVTAKHFLSNSILIHKGMCVNLWVVVVDGAEISGQWSRSPQMMRYYSSKAQLLQKRRDWRGVEWKLEANNQENIHMRATSYSRQNDRYRITESGTVIRCLLTPRPLSEILAFLDRAVLTKLSSVFTQGQLLASLHELEVATCKWVDHEARSPARSQIHTDLFLLSEALLKWSIF